MNYYVSFDWNQNEICSCWFFNWLLNQTKKIGTCGVYGIDVELSNLINDKNCHLIMNDYDYNINFDDVALLKR